MAGSFFYAQNEIIVHQVPLTLTLSFRPCGSARGEGTLGFHHLFSRNRRSSCSLFLDNFHLLWPTSVQMNTMESPCLN